MAVLVDLQPAPGDRQRITPIRNTYSSDMHRKVVQHSNMHIFQEEPTEPKDAPSSTPNSTKSINLLGTALSIYPYVNRSLRDNFPSLPKTTSSLQS